MNRIKNKHTHEINVLLEKLGKDSYDELFLGVGAKYSKYLNHIKNVDYIFVFDFGDADEILFSVAVINLDLVDFFKPLKDDSNRLQGIIRLDKIYRICKEN